MTEKFPWFAARLLFEARTSENTPIDLYEERIIVVRSEAGADAAEKKARKLGQSQAHGYVAADGSNVEWRFVELLDVVQLNETSLEEGAEVYHHYLTPGEATQLRESLEAGSLG